VKILEQYYGLGWHTPDQKRLGGFRAEEDFEPRKISSPNNAGYKLQMTGLFDSNRDSVVTEAEIRKVFFSELRSEVTPQVQRIVAKLNKV
jgi:hypothetical protein